MTLYRKLLVHCDSEDRVADPFEAALRLAEALGASMRLMDVIEELPTRLRNPAFGLPALLDVLREEKTERLAELVRAAGRQGVAADARVVYGKPSEELVREAIAGGFDVLVVGAEVGSSSLFGTAAARLLKKCPCPVWAVRPDHSPGSERVLAAVDLDDEAEGGIALAADLLRHAAALAAALGAELHVVNAWGDEKSWSEKLGDFAHEVESSARARLDDFLADEGRPLPADHVHVVAGRPGPAVCDLAKRIEADILVIGNVARSGVRSLVFGGTAERVLEQARCAVFVVKAADFTESGADA